MADFVQTYSAQIVAIQPERYSFENAEDWVRPSSFQDWYDEYMQRAHTERKSATPMRSLPATPSRVRSLSVTRTPSSVARTPSSGTPGSRLKRQRAVSSTPFPRILPPIFEISDSEDDCPTPKRKCHAIAKTKVKLEPRTQPDIIILDSDSDDSDVQVISGPLLKKIKVEPDTNSLISITRQRHVKKLIKLTSIPRCWDIPHDGRNTAYLLDLSGDPREWKDEATGELRSMAAIIKSEVCFIYLFPRYGLVNFPVINRIKTPGGRVPVAQARKLSKLRLLGGSSAVLPTTFVKGFSSAINSHLHSSKTVNDTRPRIRTGELFGMLSENTMRKNIKVVLLRS